MSGRFVYDYYKVSVPGDVYADDDSWEEQTGQLAIQQAEEKTKLYATPAIWTATRIHGDAGSFEVEYRVCRKRHKREPAIII